MNSDLFNPHVVTIGYQRYELEDIEELPKGKLPRKLKKRLKAQRDNPNRKRVFKGHYKTVSLGGIL